MTFLTLFSSFAYARGLPHSEQNFPLFTVPHAQVQSVAGAGLPHSGQNLPLLVLPHSQVHVPAAGADAGAGAG